MLNIDKGMDLLESREQYALCKFFLLLAKVFLLKAKFVGVSNQRWSWENRMGHAKIIIARVYPRTIKYRYCYHLLEDEAGKTRRTVVLFRTCTYAKRKQYT